MVKMFQTFHAEHKDTKRQSLLSPLLRATQNNEVYQTVFEMGESNETSSELALAAIHVIESGVPGSRSLHQTSYMMRTSIPILRFEVTTRKKLKVIFLKFRNRVG
jgi:hypothetical protein